MKKNDFTHLHIHTEYSLLDGMSSIKKLVKKVKNLGMTSCAITDHGVLYGAHEFYDECKKNDIKAIIGVEIYLAVGSRKDKTHSRNENYSHLTLLAENEEGYKNLIKIVSDASVNGFYYKPRTDIEFLKSHSKGIIALSGCLGGDIPMQILKGNIKEAYRYAEQFIEIFGQSGLGQSGFGQSNFYLEVQRNGIKEQDKVNEVLFKMGNDLNIPLVATCDSHYLDKEDSYAHEVLLCIETGKTIDDNDRLKLGSNEFYVKGPEEMIELWQDHPECIENTNIIRDRCNVEIKFNGFIFPNLKIPKSYNGDFGLRLKDLVFKRGKEKLERDFSENELERINYELDIIISKGFASYMLMVADFTDYLSRENIPTTTRGSAAGSYVAYLIGIVPINPLIFGLSFERFLNPLRPKAPDIDLDIASARREDVLNYAVSKYGYDRVSQIVTFGRMKARAAIRDVGRVLKVPLYTVDKIAKLIPQGEYTIKEATEKIPEIKDEMKDPTISNMLNIAQRMEGIARHASIHACGVLITPENLDKHVPISFDRKLKRLVCQYNMVTLEELGYMKMDFLGLTNLDIISESQRLILENRNEDVDFANIPLDDKKTFRMLKDADTLGVFQIESRIMKDAIKILKPENIFDISALIALNRPGPMANIPHYAARKEGREKVEYIDPRMESYLKRSYGVMVYQEDLLRTAINLAGFDWGEVDKLRKATGKKKPEILLSMKDSLIDRFIEHGMKKEIAEKLFDLFMPFAHYAFNEAHAASYSIISYRTSYIKANYPVEFLAALLQSHLGNLEKIAEIILEAERKKIKILPPDINKSIAEFHIEDNNIRYGLNSIKGLATLASKEIIKARAEGGEFKSLDDFCNRVNVAAINKTSFEVLIKSGTMDAFGKRAALLQDYNKIVLLYNDKKISNKIGQIGFFEDDNEDDIPYTSLSDVEESSALEKALWEKELLGIYVTYHPLKKYVLYFKNNRILALNDFENIKNGTKVSIGGLIQDIKYHMTKNSGKRMAFARIEDLISDCEIIIFPDTYLKIKDKIPDNGSAVIVKGTVNIVQNDRVTDSLDEDIEIMSLNQERIEYKVIVDDIITITDEDLAKDKEKKIDKVEINVANKTTKAQLIKLSEMLKTFEGDISVLLRLNGDRVINLKSKIVYNEEFRTAIENIIGTNSLNVVYV